MPSTFRGYTKILLLRLISQSKSSVLIPPKLSSYSDQLLPPYFQTARDEDGMRTIEKSSRKGSLAKVSSKSLPYREGPRPYTAGLAPHRQITQRAPAEWVLKLEAALRDLATENSSTLCTGKSCFEKHSLGIFLAYALCSRIADAPSTLSKGSISPVSSAEIQSGIGEVGSTTTLCGDESLPVRGKASALKGSQNPKRIQTTCGYPPEIAHMHGTDGSLHVTLHPLDVAYILKRGWGERHPLAGRWLGSGFMMIYAPRDEEELKVILEIVQAGARWVGGVDWAT